MEKLTVKLAQVFPWDGKAYGALTTIFIKNEAKGEVVHSYTQLPTQGTENCHSGKLHTSHQKITKSGGWMLKLDHVRLKMRRNIFRGMKSSYLRI